jgi:hypothetical protein
VSEDDYLMVLHVQHQEMGQSRCSFIVKVNLQVGRQVFLPGEKILSNVIAQPLKVMSRNIGATVPRAMSVAGVDQPLLEELTGYDRWVE